MVAPDLLSVDVDVHDGNVVAGYTPFERRPLTELASDRDQAIRLAKEPVRGIGPEPPRYSERERVILLDDPFAADRGGKRSPERVDQRPHLVVGAGDLGTAADEYRRPAACRDRLHGRRHRRRIRRRARPRERRAQSIGVRILGGRRREDVIRDLQHDGSRAIRCRDPDAVVHDVVQAVRVVQPRVPLRAWREDAPLVERLRRRAQVPSVLPGTRDVGHDRERWNRRAVGLDQARHEVRRTRPDRRVAHPHRATQTRVRVRRDSWRFARRA